jgi:hypothetical protein
LLSLPAEPLLKCILVIDPRKQSIAQVDDTDLTSLIDSYLGDTGVDKLQLDHDNTIWFSDKKISNRYAWYFEGLATGEYEVRRYGYGIIVGFGENTAWDKVTLVDYLRWFDRQNVWGDQ